MQTTLLAPERAQISILTPAPTLGVIPKTKCEICGGSVQMETPCFFPLVGVWRVAVRCQRRRGLGRLSDCPVRWIEVTE